MAVQGRFVELVRGCGLATRLLPGDPVRLVRLRAKARSAGEIREISDAFVEQLGMGVVAAAGRGTDLLLTSFGAAPLSRLAAEAFGIPAVGTYLAPAVATADFPLPGSPDISDGGGHWNLTAGQTFLTRTGQLYAHALPRLRARLGLRGAPGSHPWAFDWPICHGYSASVVPRPTDWPPGVEVTGYWWPARPRCWHPPGELIDFLQAGPPPVFIGFGSSMHPGRAEWLGDLVAAAVHQAGVRAVVQAGFVGLKPAGDDIFTVGDLPHDWLFPRTAAVVHHAGAGTSAAGVRAGVPAVPVPVAFDQPFWADRLRRLGVAPAAIPLRHLTAEALGAALSACLSGTAYRERAAELARRVRDEDGAAPILALVDRLAG